MQQGGCLCGAVRYELTGDPIRSGICHCQTCRKAASAQAMAFAVFPAGAIRFVQGEPRTFRSSARVVRSFCGNCGSPLTYRSEGQPDQVSVMTGSLDLPELAPPTYHLWASHKIAWYELADGLHVYETTRSAAVKA